jgi:general stress protein 26
MNDLARPETMLAAVRATMAEAPDCWVATPSADGGVNMRVVMPIPRSAGEDEWTISIATSGASRKAGEIRRSGRATLGYFHPRSRAYVALMGRAELVEDRAEIRARWRDEWRLYFPGGPDDPHTTFVRLRADRIECCIPGVTPEPFGSRYSVIDRDAAGKWAVTAG